MSRYIIRNRLAEPDDLRGFDLEGYRYNDALSDTDSPVFTRSSQSLTKKGTDLRSVPLATADIAPLPVIQRPEVVEPAVKTVRRGLGVLHARGVGRGIIALVGGGGVGKVLRRRLPG